MEDPRSERTVRRYLTKLEDYILAESHGRGLGRTYEPILELENQVLLKADYSATFDVNHP